MTQNTVVKGPVPRYEWVERHGTKTVFAHVYTQITDSYFPSRENSSLPATWYSTILRAKVRSPTLNSLPKEGNMANPICLVVDDEPRLRTYLSIVLQSGGFDVIEAGNGIQALDALRTA